MSDNIPGNKKLWLRLQLVIILPQRSNRTISSFWLNNVVIQTVTPPSYPLVTFKPEITKIATADNIAEEVKSDSW